jgi:hypothetical protein
MTDMAIKRTPQQVGRLNRRAGKAWQMACAQWLRDHHYPNAAYEIRDGSSDIIGTGDMAVECTKTGWDQIWAKLRQAERDGTARGLDLSCVWKKRNGATSAGEGVVLMRAEKFWGLMADLDAYQRTEMDFADTWDKAFAAGFRAGMKGHSDDTENDR